MQFNNLPRLVFFQLLAMTVGIWFTGDLWSQIIIHKAARAAHPAAGATRLCLRHGPG